MVLFFILTSRDRVKAFTAPIRAANSIPSVKAMISRYPTGKSIDSRYRKGGMLNLKLTSVARLWDCVVELVMKKLAMMKMISAARMTLTNRQMAMESSGKAI